jgi:4,5-DOPA dioxygenase extradiol
VGCTGSKEETMETQKGRMPVLFVGHGSPMNIIEDNAWSRGFSALRGLTPKPKAILAISAHWFVSGTYLTADAEPRTIHDFGGFPRALYEIEYPAKGSVDLARRVRRLLGEEHAGLSHDWGLDHGTWSVLHHMFPEADVPVVQLSLDARLDFTRHLELARSLAPLREEGVLIAGSGNVVHNLRDAFTRMRTGSFDTPAWATRFDEDVRHALTARDERRLLDLTPNTDDGRLSHPTPDHFLTLLYAYGATDEADRATFPIEGFDLGSISMRSVRFG